MKKHFATLAGIKHAAIRHKREAGISHGAALDVVARQAGFANYVTAYSAYTAGALPAAPPQFPITIHQYWITRDRTGRGHESRTFNFDRPLTALVTKHQMKGYFGGSRIEDDTNLIAHGYADSIGTARAEICRLARALQFIAATGLKPSRGGRCYPKGEWDNRPPGADHDTTWYDPATRQFLLTTEPYPGRMEGTAHERAAWSDKHGWRVLRSRWGSVYGYGTELYLVGKAKGGLDLDAFEQKLARLPDPFEEADWPLD